MYFSVLSVSSEALSLIRELIIQPSVEDRKLVLWGRRIAWFSIPALRLSSSMVFLVSSGWVLSISLPFLVEFLFLRL